jgi:uncharacterized YigZ family protein
MRTWDCLDTGNACTFSRRGNNAPLERKIIPAGEHRTEIRVINSRFIATIAPVFSVDEARAFIQQVKEEFADASHNVPAYIVGHGASVIAHCNDDGEPSGTAGRPALAVLQGSGLGDAAVVITRYFGGTKLGTGGLVRAYGDAVRSVLAELPKAEKVATDVALLAVPYNLYEQVTLLVEAQRGLTLDTTFAADVTLTLQFRRGDLAPFNNALSELSHGALEAELVDSDDSTIMPLPGDDENDDRP